MQKHDRKPPTIKDVAAHAGVSVMTASRAINGKALVSAGAREAVAQAVKALGYVPNASARALAGSADRRVALLHSNSTTSAYLGELLLGALAEAPQRHLHLVVEQCAPGAFAQEIVDQVAQAHVAGVILPLPTLVVDLLVGINITFGVMLLITILIFGALTFFPAAALGPVAEHLTFMR